MITTLSKTKTYILAGSSSDEVYGKFHQKFNQKRVENSVTRFIRSISNGCMERDKTEVTLAVKLLCGDREGK